MLSTPGGVYTIFKNDMVFERDVAMMSVSGKPRREGSYSRTIGGRDDVVRAHIEAGDPRH